MGIASFKPDAPSPVNTSLPKVQPDGYKSIINDDRYTPMQSLIAYVPGASWTVNYYNQVLSDTNDLRQQDPGQNNVYQQYSKITGFEIKVEEALTNSQDPQTNAMLVTGSGMIYPNITPNVGDMFVASTGNGQDGLFTITNVSRKIYMRDSVFAIEYVLTAYLSNETERYQDLESKVLTNYFFHKNFLIDGQNPVIRAEDYQNVISLESSFGELTEFFFNSFFNNEFNTLIIPGQKNTIYDHFLTMFVLKIVTTTDSQVIRNIRRLNVDDDMYMKQPTIWDALIDNNSAVMPFINKKSGLVMTTAFSSNAYLEGIRYSYIDYIVYPKDPDLSGINNVDLQPKELSDSNITETGSRHSSPADVIYNFHTMEAASVQIIKSPIVDDYYVFSDAFYNNRSTNKCLLEMLVSDYLAGKAIDNKKLSVVVSDYPNWSRLDQYYFIPVLLLLIKVSIGTM